MAILQKQKIFLASDHAGFELKDAFRQYFASNDQFEVIDLGAFDAKNPASYARQGILLGKEIAIHKNALGIGVCGTGIGISIAANRVRGVRAARVTTIEDGQLARAHNNANVLTFGNRQIDFASAVQIFNKFYETKFENGRHTERIMDLDQ